LTRTLNAEQDIELLAWRAAVARLDKLHLENPTAALKAIGCDESEWAQPKAD
jgi:hypothetical protein